MLKLIFITLNLFVLISAQNNIEIKVYDNDTKQPLSRANVFLENTNIGSATNENGIAEIINIPDGEYKIIVSMIGYEKFEKRISFPSELNNITVFLEFDAEEIEEIFVSSTRVSRLIDDEPIRVEVIAGEEIEEKIIMEPSNISMMLSESTGIQVQQTSAVSGNVNFRIQGLDGKYTLLLKDGFPLYSGYSGGLSLLQVPPLDLKQVEIIKGSSSTLYGGGAISGLINLISKKPSEKREISFLTNINSALGLDLSGYYSEKFEKFGLSILTARNSTKEYDNNNDSFSDIPKSERYSINPHLIFYFDEDKTLEIGGSISLEERLGGDMNYIENKIINYSPYYEKNISKRYSVQSQYQQKSNSNNILTLKNSFGYFNRKLNLSDYIFNGNQISFFSELTYSTKINNLEWVFGGNLYSENFNDERINNNSLSYDNFISGAFIQNTWNINENLIFENGLRTDYSSKYGFFPLPKTSLLIKWNNFLTSRIGGGLGYKIPTIFIEEAEELNFINILTPAFDNLKVEKSYGINFDINYRGILAEEISYSINQLFFYTRINNPLYLEQNSSSFYELSSSKFHFDSKGIETNIKLGYDHLKLFLGYSFVEVYSHTDVNKEFFPLTPKHKLGLVLMFEEHGNYRFGFESYYTGIQKLRNGTSANDYWILGLMLEKRVSSITFFINFENFLDARQSKFGPMFSGSLSNPSFLELYAPTDGRIINGGFKLSF